MISDLIGSTTEPVIRKRITRVATTMIAKAITRPITTGMSPSVVERTLSWPMPGIAKICSTTNEPVMRKPSSGPAAVTAGMSEFRSVCTSTTRR